jgi:hypothetical protein
MELRQRLNFGDETLRRADQLNIGQRFIDTLPWWDSDNGHIVVREIRELRLVGDDIEIVTQDGRELTTSASNTFLVLPARQLDIRHL